MIFLGGYYHGKLIFAPTFPMSPPSILMITPSGRFRPDTRLCLTISDFHPETVCLSKLFISIIEHISVESGMDSFCNIDGIIDIHE